MGSEVTLPRHKTADLAAPACSCVDDLGQTARCSANGNGLARLPHARISSRGTHHFGRPDPEDISMGMQVENERNIRLSSVLRRPGAKLIYTYDFGDNWEHAIVLEKLLPLMPGTTDPICIDGSLACPPDDCGGILGPL